MAEGLTVLMTDITGRKLAENELKIKNEELNSVVAKMEATNEELVATGEELKVKEKALLREKIFVEALLESIPGFLYVYDNRGRLVRWNKKFEQITGYSSEELPKVTLDQWFEKDDAERVAATIKKIDQLSEGDV